MASVDRHVACPSGKTPYTSVASAREALRSLRSGDRLRVYQCERCRRWHLTSATGGESAQRRFDRHYRRAGPRGARRDRETG